MFFYLILFPDSETEKIADVIKGIPYVQCSKLFPRKLQI